MKTAKPQIHFLREVLPAVGVLYLKDPIMLVLRVKISCFRAESSAGILYNKYLGPVYMEVGDPRYVR